MKINRWARIQTFRVLRSSSLWIFAILLPVFVFGMIWNQISNIDSEFAANKKNIIVSLQTGDMITLEKALSVYTQAPGLRGYELFDKDRQLVKKSSNSTVDFVFSKKFSLYGTDHSLWGELSVFWAPIWSQLFYFALMTLMIVGVVALVSFRSWRKISQILIDTIEIVPDALNKPTLPSLFTEIDELNFLFEKLQLARKQEIENQKLLLQREKEAALIELSQKVAHDIRSPLSAISLVSSVLDLADDRMTILKNAIQRLNDICSILLKAGRESRSPLRLDTAIQEIIAEKNITTHRTNFSISYDKIDDSLSIPNTEFKDVISNLLQNSIEAFEEGTGRIHISTKQIGCLTEISIEDNGKGIPKDVLSTLGNSPVTFGKGSNGNGLGLYNAKNWANSNGGDLNINSSSTGTKITFSFEVST